ncbi:formate-tetrahydrofolate ligase [Balneicella halophila]|uniref:Formate--tetrahydrofolate ligase n=1 Tax=Balneicella halophila TaxID=1537566 RepID=A0A7L4UQZ1_BALHA|nr:formate--tetrahydrofolate ligase [Balneicella halophila]PVX51861.1 formate-tetrahydrofolate ligase [Balneicella halophila]
MKSDIQIAQEAEQRPIKEIASKLNIDELQYEPYGRNKAKLPLNLIDEEKVKKSNLVLVTAITPTPAGEGKTTTSIGLSMGLNRVGKNAIVVIREPSLGPVFGIKGGAAGGGYSQVIPMEEINLHFTGDMAAVEKAHNLLVALVDNILQFKNDQFEIDPRTITLKRVMDMNDRALRNIVIGLGGTTQGVPRETGFNITAASEVMAILCLATDLEDLKKRLGNMLIGYTFDGDPVFARDINAHGAMATLLKEAIKPNLVQTLEGTPAIIHGGPFANIAQGTNTVLATKMGMSLADYTITEAGFASELGAEKFFDIKCKSGGLEPVAVVIVATIRALKYHGGAKLADLANEDIEALQKGFANLDKHIENIQHFGYQPVIGINQFATDSEKEIALLEEYCEKKGVKVALNSSWEKGGEGAEDLVQKVIEAAESYKNTFKFLYNNEFSFKEKIEAIATKMYGAKGVEYSLKARKNLEQYEKLGVDLNVCIAKTQKSLSDDAKLKGRPTDFIITIRDVEIASGAGFIIPIAGSIMRMPGLPKVPSAEKIDIDVEGNISGLF